MIARVGRAVNWVLVLAVFAIGQPAAHGARYEIDKVFSVLDALLRDLPRDAFEPAAVVERIGKNPTELFEFVRDKTGLVAYAGSLRGPVGVLMDRLGNSLDRALLLAKLLRTAGHRVRLVRAQLGPEQVTTVAKALARGYLPRLDAGMVADAVEKYWKPAGLDVATLQREATKRQEAQERLARLALTRIDAQTSALSTAFRGPGSAATVSDTLRDHFWIQCEEAGQWVDLDPTLHDAVPGKTLAAVGETLVPEKLPAGLSHEVEIRVVVERWDGTRLSEALAVTHTLRASDALGTSIAIGHVQVTPAPDFSKVPTTAELSRVDAWKPVVFVGSTPFDDLTFDARGRVAKQAQNVLAKPMGNPLGTLTGGVESESANGVLTAEWIDYIIRSPGVPTRTIRREVFDLIGPDGRKTGVTTAPVLSPARALERVLALLEVTNVAIWSAQMSPQAVAHLYGKRMLANRALVTRARKGQVATLADVHESTKNASPLPGLVYGLAVTRQAWGPLGRDAYLDRPNVFTSRRIVWQTPTNRLGACEGFDIVANEVAPFPGTTDAFGIRIRQGIVDTNAEALLRGKSSCPAENTSDLFAASGGADWLTLTSPDAGPLNKLEHVSADVRARIEDDLRGGSAVMVPSRPSSTAGRPAIAWWRVNKVTGTTLGIDSHGRGGNLTEAVETVNFGRNMISSFLCLFKANYETERSRVTTGAMMCMLEFGLGAAGGVVALGGAGGFVREGVAHGLGQGIILLEMAFAFVEAAEELDEDE